MLLVSLPLAQLSADFAWRTVPCSGCGLPEVTLGAAGRIPNGCQKGGKVQIYKDVWKARIS